MDILVISGFLGSGKTTLLLALVPLLRERYSRIAVVENEIGEVGIDGTVVGKHGIATKELFAGCICCTLGTDFIKTLKDLSDHYSPELVVVEPTGIANPDSIVAATERYPWPDEIGAVRVISLFDPTRFEELSRIFEVPIKKQLACAEMIIVTKSDLSSPGSIESTLVWLRDRAPGRPIITFSKHDQTSASRIVQRLVN